MRWFRRGDGSGQPTPSCWLWQFDEQERPCSGRLEAFHFFGRQRIRNALWPLLRGVVPQDCLDDLIELAEWDSRNAGPGCEGHHRRLDNQATPGLHIPAAALPLQVIAFTLDWGLELEAERRFDQTEATFGEVVDVRSNLLERYWGLAHAA
jgi:hypothetical protein